MSKQEKQPKIYMVQLLQPVRFGSSGATESNLYSQEHPNASVVDNGKITMEWDQDSRFIRVTCLKTGWVQLLSIANVGSITVK